MEYRPLLLNFVREACAVCQPAFAAVRGDAFEVNFFRHNGDTLVQGVYGFFTKRGIQFNELLVPTLSYIL